MGWGTAVGTTTHLSVEHRDLPRVETCFHHYLCHQRRHVGDRRCARRVHFVQSERGPLSTRSTARRSLCAVRRSLRAGTGGRVVDGVKSHLHHPILIFEIVVPVHEILGKVRARGRIDLVGEEGEAALGGA